MRLREAHAEGRLDAEEFHDRLDAAFTARTLAELSPLTQDLPLPAPSGSHLMASRHPGARGGGGVARTALTAAWVAWAVAVSVNLVVWALVSLSNLDLEYFWPMWVAGPWGTVLLVSTFAQRRGGQAPR